MQDLKREISIDLIYIFSNYKRLIIYGTLITSLIMIAFLILSLVLPPDISYLPNVYTSKALILINENSSSKFDLSTLMNASSLSGISNIAGVSLTASTNKDLAIYLVNTDRFLDAVAEKFDIITRYKIKKYIKSESREILKKKFEAKYDKKSGVCSISFTDWDPEFSKRVVDFSVEYLNKLFDELQLDRNKIGKKNLEENISNTIQEILRLENQSRQLESIIMSGKNLTNIPSMSLELNRIKREMQAQEAIYTQLKVQYEMLKISIASETPTFQILQPPEIPDKKSGPSRSIIMILAIIISFFSFTILSIIIANVQYYKRIIE